MNTNWIHRAGLALALGWAATAGATPVVSYDSISGHELTGYGLGGGYFESAFGGSTRWTGQKFTAASNGYISSLVMNTISAGAFQVSLYSDDGGVLGEHLGALTLSGASAWPAHASGEYDSGVELLAGHDYWLALGPDLIQHVSWWYVNGLSASGPNALFTGEALGHDTPTALTYYNNANTNALGAIVTLENGVSPVPEPGTAALAGLGLLAFGALRLRRRS